MRSRFVRTRFLLAAALVLAATCAAVAEESFFHTDDGCPVETHCVACRLATGTIAVLAAALPLPQRTAAVAQRVWTPVVHPRGPSTAAATPSRAPPSA
ncbi:MAG TPA: hypothetical protein VGQ33_24085 [Vicinamibacteria bacterium]|nr:hypothetical protein [Vicinamibacteria bacterium]